MELNAYSKLAARTINPALNKTERLYHSLHMLSGEVGELHSIYQKVYQGHPKSQEHLRKEAGDILWALNEYCLANDFSLEDIARENIEKLMQRYPDGFTIEKSINRKAGDI